MSRARTGDLSQLFYESFRASVRDPALAPQLRAAADGHRLRPWTELVTKAVVRACEGLGWDCAAKGVGSRPLPVGRDEYLAIDVLAFDRGGDWLAPQAAIELENSRKPELIAYAAWKACSVRAALSSLICYRREPDEIGALVEDLSKGVLRAVKPQSEVLVVVGTRDSAGTFPDGYFRPFRWDAEAEALRWVTG